MSPTVVMEEERELNGENRSNSMQNCDEDDFWETLEDDALFKRITQNMILYSD